MLCPGIEAAGKFGEVGEACLFQKLNGRSASTSALAPDQKGGIIFCDLLHIGHEGFNGDARQHYRNIEGGWKMPCCEFGRGTYI